MYDVPNSSSSDLNGVISSKFKPAKLDFSPWYQTWIVCYLILEEIQLWNDVSIAYFSPKCGHGVELCSFPRNSTTYSAYLQTLLLNSTTWKLGKWLKLEINPRHWLLRAKSIKRTSFRPRDIRKNPRSMYARVPQSMAQFVLKIEKLSHIMGTAPLVELARAYGLHPRLWFLIRQIIQRSHLEEYSCEWATNQWATISKLFMTLMNPSTSNRHLIYKNSLHLTCPWLRLLLEFRSIFPCAFTGISRI